jgi:2-polyprenyl-3-methyl-5-hydroxy-6-metoxy-1,4-benzoquinol methylase
MLNNNRAYFDNRRMEIQYLVRSDARRILDVGCGFGTMGKELKKKFGAEVWGIEIESGCAHQASMVLDRFLKGSIESNIPNLPHSYFDTIIFADVLEHLYNPWQVLKDIKSKLADGGEIIASIPNVSHWFVIKQLLSGNFPYCRHGLLDISHIRFFTLASALAMFGNAGYQITFKGSVTDQYESMPLALLEICHSLGFDTGRLKEESAIAQYLFKASIKD